MQDESITQPSTRKTLRQRVMRRIYVLFMIRNISPFAFDCLVIVVVAFIATLFVSVQDVWRNLSVAESGGNLSNFSLSAFSSTELEMKLLLVVLGVVGFFTVRHLKQAVRAVRTLRGNTEQKRNAANTERDGTQ